MSFRVRVTARATRELNAAADWIARSAPRTAERWFNGFVRAIYSLRNRPRRCGLARENGRFPYELRQLLYGKGRRYRALFTIKGDAVVIVTIRHSSQRDLEPDDL
ncbi:MAG: type II toxin-antitoxin system RelE/ParE family toxin [Planctomycetia bacterium]|nr:type II toxin-antitoxin system RelE/ParE family toxin [Planctomycetia bacterium]